MILRNARTGSFVPFLIIQNHTVTNRAAQARTLLFEAPPDSFIFCREVENSMEQTRQVALDTLTTYTKSDALLRHAYAVEGVMRRFAREFGEDEAYWGMIGLLHDVDYEQWPEEHLQVAPRLLREAGFDEDVVHAVLSHGWGLCSDVKPEKKMEIVLYYHRRAHGPHHGGGVYAPEPQRDGHGSIQREEEIQGQGFRRWRQPRCDQKRLRNARHDAG